MSKESVLRYLLHLLIIFSQAANCVFLAGHPDQTISSRCWQNRDLPYWKQARIVIDVLFFFDKNHCETSYYRDVVNSKNFVEHGRFPEG